MRKIVFILLLSLSSVQLSAQYVIKGQFEGEVNKKVVLIGHRGFEYIKVDSVFTDSNGRFSLKHNYKGVGFVKVEQKSVFLILNEKVVQFSKGKKAGYFNVKFKKSRENQLFFDFVKAKNEIQAKDDIYLLAQSLHKPRDRFYRDVEKQRNKLRRKVNKVIRKVRKNMYIKHYIPIHDIFQSMPKYQEGKTTFEQALLGRMIFKKLNFKSPVLGSCGMFNEMLYRYIMFNAYRRDVVKSRDDLEVEITKDAKYILTKIKNNEELYNNTLSWFLEGLEGYGFSKAVSDISDFVLTKPQCELTQGIEQRLKKYQKVKVGAKAPNINFNPPIKGKYNSLYSVKSDFKLLVFFSSWCSHCKRDIPKLQKLYNKLKQRGIEVVAISGDREKDRTNYKKFSKGFKWLSFVDFKGWNSPGYDEYGIRSTPHYILLDRDNNIVNKFIDLANLTKALNIN